MGLIDKLNLEGSLLQGSEGLGGIQPQKGATGQSKLHDKYSLNGTEFGDVINQLSEYDTRTSPLSPQPSNLNINGVNPTGPLRNPGTVAINNTFVNGTYRDSAPPGSTSF